MNCARCTRYVDRIGCGPNRRCDVVRDPDFFEFVRTLEAYRASLGEDTTLVLSPDSAFFRYLKEAEPPPKAGADAPR